MKYVARIGEEEREYTFERRDGRLIARCGERVHELDVAISEDRETISLLVDGESFDVVCDVGHEQVVVQMRGERFKVRIEDERERAAHAVAAHKQSGKRELRAAMPGIVVDVQVELGAEVEEGQTLVVLEAMKMQNPLAAEGPGKVTRITVKPGEAVAAGALLIEIE